jgi:hypothetical protein
LGEGAAGGEVGWVEDGRVCVVFVHCLLCWTFLVLRVVVVDVCGLVWLLLRCWDG